MNSFDSSTIFLMILFAIFGASFVIIYFYSFFKVIKKEERLPTLRELENELTDWEEGRK